MTEKKKGKLLPVLIIIILVIAVAAAAAYFLLRPKTGAAEACKLELEDCLSEARNSASQLPPSIAGSYSQQLYIYGQAETEEKFRSAEITATLHQLDLERLSSGLAPEMQARLEAYVEAASRPSDIYAEDKSFLPEILEKAYLEAVNARLENAEHYCRDITVGLILKYSSGSWKLENRNEFIDQISVNTDTMPGFDEACAALEYIEFSYKLPDWTSPGPVPDAACYGETSDPADIEKLLQTDMAQKLINGQELDWNADKELIPGSTIRYYLDETILSIVWQEVEHGAVGTFAETFIADASQLRRKLADDTFGSQSFYYPTDLARQSNAVLALSGDFYDLPDRVYGLYVYDGKLLRSCLTAGQSCLFTDKGDMLFTYENQFATEQEAQDYISENNVMFSLSFGPVMIENGVDVTPYDYPLGEVRDTYARCAVGQLGERHYLSMTINCLSPDYYVYVTLRQAADSMIEHGCVNAYTLDGGQTGSIIIGGELINPVQFGFERLQSDIFYFATAIPNE